MADATVPTLSPAGVDMTPKEEATSGELGALQKLTPRQKELGESTGSVAKSGKKIKKKPVAIDPNVANRIRKFDPNSPVNYKSPFMFGTPKATSGTDHKTFLSYKKIATLETMNEVAGNSDNTTEASPTAPGSPPSNQGDLFYEGSKWFWRQDKNIHIQIYNAADCYVARCNALEAEIEYEPLFFDKAVVEECLDMGYVVLGIPTPKNSVRASTENTESSSRSSVEKEGGSSNNDGISSGDGTQNDAASAIDLNTVRRNSFGDTKALDKAAEQKAKDQSSRYFEQVAKCIIEKISVVIDGDTERLTALPAASGASMLLKEAPAGLKLPNHKFRVARKVSIGEFKRVTEKFAADLEHARGVVEKAHARAADLGDHINIWESATSCNTAEDARRHTISATEKMRIVKRLSMEASEMKLALAKMKEEDASK